MSSAVTAFVAIWQNASCGVRMLIACQLRLSTSTIVLFSMSLIKYLHTATALRAKRCLLFIEWRNWLPRQELHPDIRFQRPAHFDYATRQLATNSDPKLALEAAQTLTMRMPDPTLESTNGFGGFSPFTRETRRKLVKNSWNTEFAPPIRSLATNYLVW